MEDDTNDNDSDVPETITDIEDRENLEVFIREESGRAQCKGDLVHTAFWFLDNEITTEEDALRTSKIEDALEEAWDHGKYTILNKYLVEIGVLEKVEPSGPSTFILNEMNGEFLMGEDVDLGMHVDGYISRFIDHMQEEEADTEEEAIADGGEAEDTNEEDGDDEDDVPGTLREVAAEALEVKPEAVEDEMTSGETIERMQSLDDVVGAVKASDEVEKRDDYDQIGFRRSANRYKLADGLAHLVVA